MCEQDLPDHFHPPPGGGLVDRRRFLRGVGIGGLGVAAAGLGLTGAAVAFAPHVGALPARALAAAAQPQILSRQQWGGDLAPRGAIPAEDVRFLLVHHTASPGSDYSEGEVEGLLRGIYAYHTSAEKGWPDIAYNFFVDRFGRIWEGRTGSLAGPVAGSATGGNQGYSQLCCFLGDFTAQPPSPEAQTAMVSLLAWLADRYSVDTTPGATVQVTSKGSNLHPAGSLITATTIAAHREMSTTTCPGDAAYALVKGTFPAQVTAVRSTVPATTAPAPTEPAPTTTAAAPTTSAAPPETAPSSTTTSTSAPVTTASDADGRSEVAGSTVEITDTDGEGAGWLVPALGLGAAAAVAAGAVVWRRSVAASAPEPLPSPAPGAWWFGSSHPDGAPVRLLAGGGVIGLVAGGWSDEVLDAAAALVAASDAGAAEPTTADRPTVHRLLADLVGTLGPSVDQPGAISVVLTDTSGVTAVAAIGQVEIVVGAEGESDQALPVDDVHVLDARTESIRMSTRCGGGATLNLSRRSAVDEQSPSEASSRE